MMFSATASPISCSKQALLPTAPQKSLKTRRNQRAARTIQPRTIRFPEDNARGLVMHKKKAVRPLVIRFPEDEARGLVAGKTKATTKKTSIVFSLSWKKSQSKAQPQWDQTITSDDDTVASIVSAASCL